MKTEKRCWILQCLWWLRQQIRNLLPLCSYERIWSNSFFRWSRNGQASAPVERYCLPFRKMKLSVISINCAPLNKRTRSMDITRLSPATNLPALLPPATKNRERYMESTTAANRCLPRIGPLLVATGDCLQKLTRMKYWHSYGPLYSGSASSSWLQLLR